MLSRLLLARKHRSSESLSPRAGRIPAPIRRQKIGPLMRPAADEGQWTADPAGFHASATRARRLRRREHAMAAMKPRTGDGPLEVTKEGRGLVMRVPLEGGGRLVVELSAEEASALSQGLSAAVG